MPVIFIHTNKPLVTKIMPEFLVGLLKAHSKDPGLVRVYTEYDPDAKVTSIETKITPFNRPELAKNYEASIMRWDCHLTSCDPIEILTHIHESSHVFRGYSSVENFRKNQPDYERNPRVTPFSSYITVSVDTLKGSTLEQNEEAARIILDNLKKVEVNTQDDMDDVRIFFGKSDKPQIRFDMRDVISLKKVEEVYKIAQTSIENLFAQKMKFCANLYPDSALYLHMKETRTR